MATSVLRCVRPQPSGTRGPFAPGQSQCQQGRGEKPWVGGKALLPVG